MKDIHSSLGGSTYPAEPDKSGIVKGVVVRNKGSYGRRIGIMTSEAEIKAGPIAHGADYAYVPKVLGELPQGYNAGVELELSPVRQYHKVLEVTGFFATRNIKLLGQLGRSDLVGFGEMSNKVAGSTAEEEKLGQVTTTSELRQLERGMGNYLFSLSIHNRGKVYHLGFDGLKHPARLTADLNYQLRKMIPGASGYFEMVDSGTATTQNGEVRPQQKLTLYLSVKPEQGDLAIMAYRVPNYETTKTIGDSLLPSTPMHINNELTDHITVNSEGVTVTVPDGEFVTTYRDEVIPVIGDLVADAVKLTDLGGFQDQGTHFLWEPVIPASLFKTYAPDPRFRVAVLQLNHPGELSLIGLKLTSAKYKMLSGDRQADFLPVRGYFDGIVERTAPVTIFGVQSYVGSDFELSLGDLSSEHDFQFGEKGGVTAELAGIRDRDFPTYYVAVIAPPEDLNDVPMFRKANDVTLSIQLEKIVYPRHVLDNPPRIQATWDGIYTKLNDYIPFPALTGEIVEDAALVEYSYNYGDEYERRSDPRLVDGKIETRARVTYQDLLDMRGYINDFPIVGRLVSAHYKDTLTLGFADNVNFEMNLTYPPTNLSLSSFNDIIYVKGNPANNPITPLHVLGTILGGFPNAPLKHATTVEWEFYIVDGVLITPTDETELPGVGALTKAVKVGFDKAIFEALDETEHFLNIKLTVRYPWLQVPVVKTVAVPIFTSVYVPGEEDEEVKQHAIAFTVPENVKGVRIYDADTGEDVLVVESLYNINTGAYWDAMDAAGVSVSYPGRAEEPNGPA